MNKLIGILFLLVLPLFMFSQKTPLLEKLVSIDADHETPEEILQLITQKTGVQFSYNPQLLKSLPLANLHMQNRPLRLVLKRVLGEGIQFKERGKYVILQKGKTPEKIKVVEGYINEPLTGANIKNATIYDKSSFASAITNEYGYFRIEVPKEDTSVIMVSKSGRTDTVLTSVPEKAEFVEVSFSPSEKDTTRDQAIVEKKDKNAFFPQWLVSERLLINTLNLSDTFFQKVSFSVLPYVSTNRFLTGNSVNNIAINLTIGYCQEIKVAEFGMINIVRDDVRYLQLAYLANITGGHMTGYQAASVFNISRSFLGIQNAGWFNISTHGQGIQMAGLFNKTQYIFGAQLGGVFNKADSVKGVQIAGVFSETDTIQGLQLSGVFNEGNYVAGTQIAGVFNTSRKNDSCQIAGVLNIAKDASKYQIAGLLNVSGRSKKMQMAPFNVAKQVDFLQIGVLNFADSCNGVPFGVLSFVKKGVHSLQIAYDETRYGSIGFRTGVKRFYNILEVGNNLGFSNADWYLAYGLGTSFSLNPKHGLFVEVMQKNYLQNFSFSDNIQLFNSSVGYQYQLRENMALTLALTYNLMLFDPASDWQKERSVEIAPYTFKDHEIPGNSNNRSWIGLKAGFRFF